LVQAARQQPGRLNYASPGVGTPHHLSMELFKNTARVFLTHIPYRGTGPAVTDLLGGQVDAMFLPIHVALPHIRSGRMVALGIGSDKRHALLPDLPTLAEAKAGNVNVDMWYGVFAPKGTPADIVNLYNREINKLLGGVTETYLVIGLITGLSILIANRWFGDPLYVQFFFAIVLGGWLLS
jgi:tripartite-type tricarboxylate transporter receptor subunit TctC